MKAVHTAFRLGFYFERDDIRLKTVMFPRDDRCFVIERKVITDLVRIQVAFKESSDCFFTLEIDFYKMRELF